MKILITTSSFGKYDKLPIDMLYSKGFEICINPFGHTLSKKEALMLYTPDVYGVVAGVENISREIIARARNLKVISRVGIGLDNIDMKTAARCNIRIFNTPKPAIDAVAELTLGFILCFLRNIINAYSDMRHDSWQKPTGILLKGKTLGIIGLGNIGKRLVELVSPFGVRFLAYDKEKDKDFAEKYDITYMDLNSILSQSDIISLHLPLTEETEGLINKDNISLIRPNTFLINTSRGSILDEKALVEVLKRKKIAGAAIDVFKQEPYQGPLTKLDNVILTPHIGSYTKETRRKMEIEAAQNLIKGLSVYGSS